MNLANLVDPAWAQERFRPRALPTAVAALMVEVAAPKPSHDVGGRIRRALAMRRAAAPAAEIAVLAQLTLRQVESNIKHLLARAEVLREGRRRHYRYSLTPLGRARL